MARMRGRRTAANRRLAVQNGIVRLFRVDAVRGDDSLIERRPRLGPAGVGEFTDRMLVRPPRTRARQAVEDCVLQVRQSEYCFGRALAF
jgi:hypothetical protein